VEGDNKIKSKTRTSVPGGRY